MTGTFLHRLTRCERGSTAIEFAALGPLFILLMLTVFQIATAVQAYNGLSGALADLQRAVVVQSQVGTSLSTSQIQTNANALATSQPYFLKSTALTTTVALAPTQRISGATEYTVTMAYNVPVMVFPSMKPFKFTYKRAIFVKSAS